MSGEAMTADRARAIRERVEADGAADMRCVWCRVGMPESGEEQPCSAPGFVCERDSGDECQQDRGELFDEVERLLSAVATVTAERDDARADRREAVYGRDEAIATLRTARAERDEAREQLARIEAMKRNWGQP